MKLSLQISQESDHTAIITYWSDSCSCSGELNITAGENSRPGQIVNITTTKQSITINLVKDYGCVPGNIVLVRAVLTTDNPLVLEISSNNCVA